MTLSFLRVECPTLRDDLTFLAGLAPDQPISETMVMRAIAFAQEDNEESITECVEVLDAVDSGMFITIGDDQWVDDMRDELVACRRTENGLVLAAFYLHCGAWGLAKSVLLGTMADA